MGTGSLAGGWGAGVTTAGDGQSELPAFQLEVTKLFFALPASKGFLLAGERP